MHRSREILVGTWADYVEIFVFSKTRCRISGDVLSRLLYLFGLCNQVQRLCFEVVSGHPEGTDFRDCVPVFPSFKGYL